MLALRQNDREARHAEHDKAKRLVACDHPGGRSPGWRDRGRCRRSHRRDAPQGSSYGLAVVVAAVARSAPPPRTRIPPNQNSAFEATSQESGT
jgi:hypothetical protein